MRYGMRELVFCFTLFMSLNVMAAEAENPLIGQWIDPLPNGSAMITEFSVDTISFWAVSPTGEKSAENSAPVMFEVLPNGGIGVSISGQNDTPLTAVMRGANSLELAFPGMASRRLTRRQP